MTDDNKDSLYEIGDLFEVELILPGDPHPSMPKSVNKSFGKVLMAKEAKDKKDHSE